MPTPNSVNYLLFVLDCLLYLAILGRQEPKVDVYPICPCVNLVCFYPIGMRGLCLTNMSLIYKDTHFPNHFQEIIKKKLIFFIAYKRQHSHSLYFLMFLQMYKNPRSPKRNCEEM